MTWLNGVPRVQRKICWPSEDPEVLRALRKSHTPGSQRLEWHSALYDDRFFFYTSLQSESKTLVYGADLSAPGDDEASTCFRRVCILPVVAHRLSIMPDGAGFCTAQFDRTYDFSFSSLASDLTSYPMFRRNSTLTLRLHASDGSILKEHSQSVQATAISSSTALSSPYASPRARSLQSHAKSFRALHRYIFELMNTSAGRSHRSSTRV